MLRAESVSADLISLPHQPGDRDWPTEHWPRAEIEDGDIHRIGDEIFDLKGPQGVTYALLVVKEGELVYERYNAGANDFYLEYSWSMAKSFTQALVGILVKQGKLDIYAPAAVPEWKNDERCQITLDQLLRMSSGLEFVEDYVDGQSSDVIPMLQFEGRHDTGAYAAAKPLIHEPGTLWSYSSGTTNIICRIMKEVIGGGASGMLKFMEDELFGPIGIRSATPKFDTSGTFIGSSYLLASPQDFARFGLLYLRNGIWDGRQILPEGWVDYARTPTHHDEESCYGAQWWMKPGDATQFYCGGYDGQRIHCDPGKDIVVVRCGRTPAEEAPYVMDRISDIVELM